MLLNQTVSIIVPIFNSEQHLIRCIKSLLNQSYHDIEVILVNDGSTDRSREICEHYSQTDSRVKLINQDNAGPSQARNTGILYAQGAFIQFVDADDYIEEGMTEKLVFAMNDCKDIQYVISGYLTVYPHYTANMIPSVLGVYNQNNFIKNLSQLYKDIILPSPCNKLFVTRILRQYNILFNEHLIIGEDLLFNLDYISVCETVHIVKDSLYMYCINQKSISRSFNEHFFQNHQSLIRKVEQFLVKHNSYEGQNKELLKVIYTNSVINSLTNLFHKQNPYTVRQRYMHMKTIIEDKKTRNNINYFKDSAQAKVIGFLIKRKANYVIYLLFQLKYFITKSSISFLKVGLNK